MDPFFSVVILGDGSSAHLLKRTLDTAIAQKETSFEIIIIEKSHDPIGPLLDQYGDAITRVYSSLSDNYATCLNKGITFAKGSYINFLLPGEFYISENVFQFLAAAIEENNHPNVLLTGTIYRTPHGPPRCRFPTLSDKSVKKLKLHLSLAPVFFKKELFKSVGLFSPRWGSQASFEIKCRLLSHRAEIIVYRRVVVDKEHTKFSPRLAIEEALERLKVVYTHFGSRRALLYWFGQNHLQFFRWWLDLMKGTLRK